MLLYVNLLSYILCCTPISFLDVANWMVQLRTHAFSDSPEVVLCGNKCDLEDNRRVRKKDAIEMAERYGFVESASALLQFHSLLAQVRPRLFRDLRS